jgi:predicted transcriptional regulator
MKTDRHIRINRAVAFLKEQQVIETQNDIAERMAMNPRTVSQALHGDEKYLTDSFITKFCAEFTQINKNWLLAGEGDMYAHQNIEQKGRNNFQQGQNTYGMSESIIDKMLHSHQETIKNQQIQIDKQLDLLNEKEKTINKLMEENKELQRKLLDLFEKKK